MVTFEFDSMDCEYLGSELQYYSWDLSSQEKGIPEFSEIGYTDTNREIDSTETFTAFDLDDVNDNPGTRRSYTNTDGVTLDCLGYSKVYIFQESLTSEDIKDLPFTSDQTLDYEKRHKFIF